jgi:cell wall-associated NlpC family hydrolase
VLLFIDAVNPRPPRVTHVGIKLGNGRRIGVSSAYRITDQVIVENWLKSPYWQARLNVCKSLPPFPSTRVYCGKRQKRTR